VLPAVLPPLQREFGLNDSQAGMLAPAFMLGYFLTSPFFGYLGDRMQRKWLIAAGVLVWSAGTALSGWAHGLVELMIFRVLVGFGEASYGTLSPGWIADLYPSARRNNALSFFYIAIPVGSALGQILGGTVAEHSGWRTAFYWAGLPGILVALAVLFLREPARGSSDGVSAQEGAPSKGLVRGYLSLFGYRPYVLVVAGYVAQTFALGGFALWSATFLVRIHRMALREADTFFGLSLVLTGLVATVLGGLAATAWRRRSPAGHAWVLALSAMAAVPATYGAFAAHDLGTAKLCMVAAMFMIFLSTGPVNTLILETVPVAMRACAMAASIFAIHLFGDLWSPQLVGRLSDRTGDLGKALLELMPAALAVCAVFWTWLAFACRKPKPGAVPLAPLAA